MSRISPALAETLYREYMTFFEKAERDRRWSIFDDIPWDKLDLERRNPDLALCAETFCAVEMYLPDYVSKGLQMMRGASYGQAWFMANWGYEESKHSLVLREYLVRAGYRTPADLYDFDSRVFAKEWTLPFNTPRQMTIYASIQEAATMVIYAKQRKRAAEAGDVVLASIFKLIARDEAAHARFYEKLMACMKAEDPDGFVEDLAFVFRNFQMPGVELVPDYAARIEVMRAGGIDSGVFTEEVWLPILRAVEVNRTDLVHAARRLRERAKALDGAQATVTDGERPGEPA